MNSANPISQENYHALYMYLVDNAERRYSNGPLQFLNTHIGDIFVEATIQSKSGRDISDLTNPDDHYILLKFADGNEDRSQEGLSRRREEEISRFDCGWSSATPRRYAREQADYLNSVSDESKRYEVQDEMVLVGFEKVPVRRVYQTGLNGLELSEVGYTDTPVKQGASAYSFARMADQLTEEDQIQYLRLLERVFAELLQPAER
jgi:hypothetical protein